MKQTLLISFAVFITWHMQGQKTSADNIPKAAVETFKSAYPTAEKVQWELDEENFEVGFVLNKQEKSSHYTSDGIWLRTETPVRVLDLPKIVRQTAFKNFKGCKIVEPVKVETPDKGIIYNMELAKDELVYEVTINDSGNMIMHKEKEDKEKEKLKEKKKEE